MAGYGGVLDCRSDNLLSGIMGANMNLDEVQEIRRCGAIISEITGTIDRIYIKDKAKFVNMPSPFKNNRRDIELAYGHFDQAMHWLDKAAEELNTIAGCYPVEGQMDLPLA